MTANNDQQSVDLQMINALAATLGQYKLTRIRYQKGDLKIDLEQQKTPQMLTNAATAGSVSLPADTALTTNDTTNSSPQVGDMVVSPFVGTVYLAPSPDTPPFVKVGDTVEKGDTVLIVESMKVMTPIPAPCAGTIHSILINNGEPVEYNQELLSIVRG